MPSFYLRSLLALAAGLTLIAAQPATAADSAAPVAASTPGTGTASPPPVAAFFKPPRFGVAELSPDGQRVAFTSPGGNGDRLRLAVLDLASGKATVAVGLDEADIDRIEWVNNHRLVFTAADHGVAWGKRDSAPGLFAVEADGSGFRRLVHRQAPGFLRTDEWDKLLPWNTFLLGVPAIGGGNDVWVLHPEEIDEKHADFIELQRLDTSTGRARSVDAPPHGSHWVFDPQDRLRAVTVQRDGRTRVLARAAGTTEWTTLSEFDTWGDEDGFSPLMVDEQDRLLVLSTHGRNTRALFAYDLRQRALAPAPLLASPDYDLSPEPVWRQGRVVGWRLHVDARVTQWSAPDLVALQQQIDQRLPSTSNELQVAREGEGRWTLVHAASDRVPGQWLVHDGKTGQMTRLGNVQPGIDPKTQGTMALVHYKARDGLDIPAWLTLPPGPAGAKRPLVVLVHGGPWVRGGDWLWDPQVQFLATRGYAVLEPEFRGSTGFGSRLELAGWKQWGLAMDDDLIDGVRWAVAQGHADADRVCVMGASYGGYATLMSLILHPEVWRCGVAWAAVTDIDLMYSAGWSDLNDTWKRHGMPQLIGDRVKDAAQLAATSPLKQAARLKTPLLLAHGTADHRVPIEHAERFRDALDRRQREQLTWLRYDDEGHGWDTQATNLAFWGQVEGFLKQHLAPR